MNEAEFQALEQSCKACRACGLCQTRHNVVFGTGNPKAEVLFIGEGPGENEDKQGLPFVGRGGQLLDTMLEAVGLSRKHNIYIANMVKCRPPQNRDPLPEEQDACAHWLADQIAYIRPKIIVCLGRVAAFRMISPDFKVTRQHGQFFEKDGILYMGMFHPAAILRNPNQKPEAFADFVTLRDKILEICPNTELVFED
ncbi:MAG: uracil-DNA glycosylase [Clostridia bacterium]|nr:uracil-DNA glycosylase [Clostridia bacterium]